MFAFEPALTWLMTVFLLILWRQHDGTNIHTFTHAYSTKALSCLHTLTQSTMATTASMPLAQQKNNLRGRLLSSLGRHLRGRKYFLKRQIQTSLIHRHARLILPLSLEILVCFGNALQHAPDTSLSDINLIKMICGSPVINQARQNDKWEIIFREEISKSCWGRVPPEHLIWLTSLAPYYRHAAHAGNKHLCIIWQDGASDDIKRMASAK